MAQTVRMYKRISNTTISAPIPEKLILAHEQQGWVLDRYDADHGPSGNSTGICVCDLAPGATCYCTLESVKKNLGITEPPAKPDFYALLDKMRDIHDRKAADYAPGEDRFKNFRQCEAMGVTAFEGAVVRMSDKMSRVMNLIAKQRRGEGAAVVDESIEDTLFDLAVYALIAIQLHGEGKAV